MAFPFTSGFYSKDLLLELLCVPHTFYHTIAYIFTLLAAFITSSYSVRVLMISMFSRPLFSKSLLPFVVDSPIFMTLPLIILSVGAVLLGYLSHELFLSSGSSFYMNSIFTHPNSNSFLFDAPFGATSVAFVPVLFLSIILLILYISPLNNPHYLAPSYFNLSSPIKSLSGSFSASYSPSSTSHRDYFRPSPNLTTHFTLLNYFNVFYHWFMFFCLKISKKYYRNIDKGFLELFGPTGFLYHLIFIGLRSTSLSTGFITHYAYILIMYLLLSICIFFFIF
jgi:NADH-ubiquinone oxidoreductase chain 5